MPWAFAALGVSSALGGIAGAQQPGGLFDTSKSRRRKFRNWLDHRYREMQTDYAPYYAQARAEQEGAIDEIRGGYQRARSEVSRAGQGARQAALDAGTRTMGQLSQSAIGRGLTGTTVGANLARGIASDTSRRMLEIEGALANMYAGLQTGEATAVAQGRQGLAQLSLSEFGAQQAGKEAFNQWRIFRGSGQNPPQASALPALAAGIGGLGGLYAGTQDKFSSLFGGK